MKQPIDSTEAFRQAVQHFREGDYPRAEACCRQVQQNHPNHPDALNLLGSIAMRMRNYPAAVALFNTAVQAAPRNWQAMTNLGEALRMLGQQDKAALCYEQALHLKPEHANTLLGLLEIRAAQQDAVRCSALLAKLESLNLSPEQRSRMEGRKGTLLQHEGRLAEAAHLYEKAVQAWLGNHTARLELAILRYNRLFDSYALTLPYFEQAWAFDNRDFRTVYGLAGCYYDLGLHEKRRDLLAHMEALGTLSPLQFSTLKVGETLHAFLQDDLPAMHTLLAHCASLKQSDSYPPEWSRVFDIHHIYVDYLQRLMDYRMAHAEEYSLDGTAGTLHVLGESHALTAAHLSVRWQGRPMRCRTHHLFGTKAWHLAAPGHARFKEAFTARLHTIPAGEPVIACFGEIDCRAEEGILAASRKQGGDWQQLVEDTVTFYLDFLSSQFKDRPAGLCGIPAPGPHKLAGLTPKDREALIRIIRHFNARLAMGAAERTMAFVDIHAVTANESGTAREELYLDHFHCHPSVFAAALEKL